MYYWTNAQTTKLTDNSNWLFFGLSNAASIELSHIDTSKMTDMSRVFEGCSSLTSLDVSNFNTSKVTYIIFMFSGCSGLTAIYVSDRWNTDKVTYSSCMFKNCTKLPNFSSSFIDKTHANYVEGGYLTYKAYTATAKVNTTGTNFASRFVTMLMSKLFTPVYAVRYCKL